MRTSSTAPPPRAPERLEVRDARWTLDALGALRRRISEDDAWFANAGLEHSGTTIDVAGNRVAVAVRNPGRRAARRLAERHGPAAHLDSRSVVSVLRR